MSPAVLTNTGCACFDCALLGLGVKGNTGFPLFSRVFPFETHPKSQSHCRLIFTSELQGPTSESRCLLAPHLAPWSQMQADMQLNEHPDIHAMTQRLVRNRTAIVDSCKACDLNNLKTAYALRAALALTNAHTHTHTPFVQELSARLTLKSRLVALRIDRHCSRVVGLRGSTVAFRNNLVSWRIW